MRDLLNIVSLTMLAGLFLLPTGMHANNAKVDSLKSLLQKPHSPQDELLWFNEIAFSLKTSDPVLGISYADSALDVAKTIQDTVGMARSYYMLGILNFYLGDLGKAADYLYSAERMGELGKDSLGLGRTYNNLGLVLEREGEDSQASAYYKKSFDLREKIGDQEGMIYSLIGMGTSELKLGRRTLALSNYQHALQIAKKIQDEKAKAFIYESLSQLYIEQGKYEIARKELETALSIRLDLGNTYFIAMDKRSLGEIFLRLKDRKAAEKQIKESIAISKQIPARRLELKGTELLAELYAEYGEFKKAHQCLLEASDLKDAIYNEERANALEQNKARMELRLKEQDIALLSSEAQLYELRNITLISVLLGVLLVGGLALTFFLLRIQRKHNYDLTTKNEEIARSNRELIRSNSELEDFAHAVSHDLKQPLRTIGSFSSLLVNKFGDKGDPELKTYLNFIVDGIQQMNRLLTDLLVYASVGQNGQAFEEVDLTEILEEVKQQLSRQIQESQAVIVTGVLPKIVGRRSSMRQLFQNLISNAIKFHGEKPPVVEIGYKEKPLSHLLWVKDNGIGVDNDYQEQIFNAFQRLHTQDEYPGTGLGLAICTKIVYQHHGEIRLESTPQQGATFFVELPKKGKKPRVKV